MSDGELPQATDGAEMLYLIKRRPTTSRDELIAHWFANHMPAVIAAQHRAAERGKLHATRYVATLYRPSRHGSQPWDGMAQLWWERPLPAPDVPHGTEPTDTFQQKVEPYLPWATREYVVLDGSEHLRADPLTLNDPFPTTRSGFHKVTFLVTTRPGADHEALFDHWLRVHVPNVASVLAEVGGFRYVVSHSLDPGGQAHAGMAELYFHDEAGWAEYRSLIEPDGMEAWVDGPGTIVLRADTEMVGIP